MSSERPLSEWIETSRIDDVAVAWVADQDVFESALYNTPIWNLHLELDDVGDDVFNGARSMEWRSRLAADLARIVPTAAWRGSYVLSTVVASEPLSAALVQHGFSRVGGRRVYLTRVDRLRALNPPRGGDLSFACMADLPIDRHSAIRNEMLELAALVFDESGHGRHFVDTVLTSRAGGVDYMTAVMRRNFECLGPDGFFLAFDVHTSRVCGFSVVGQRILAHSQLLSATHPSYRGRGVYSALTGLIARRLPPEAALLNITHSTNLSMQSVYARTGRVHLADTVEMRLAPETPR